MNAWKSLRFSVLAAVAFAIVCVSVRADGPADEPAAVERPAKKKRVKKPPQDGSAVELNASTSPSTGPSSNQSTTRATTGASSKPATTTASSQPADKPFPREFGILLTRSPFMRGPVASAAAAPPQPEATFGLRGIGMLDGKFIAMVENVAAKGVQQLKEGDSVASGKVKSITLDGMVYESNGKKTPVAIGQNLLGAALPALPPPPPPQPPPQPNAQPGQPGQPGQPQPGQPGNPPPGARGRRVEK